MDRLVNNDYALAIQAGRAMYPDNLKPFTACHFLTGTDPVFAGLHTFTEATYGRSMRDTAHCAYPTHQLGLPKSRRVTTVVLPVPETPETVVHELAHVMHRALRWLPTTTDVSWYAETNRFESFAEAVTAWLIPGYAPRRDPILEQMLMGINV